MKINIGLSGRKKSYFDLSHDVSTTADYGFCQPLLCRELDASASAKLRIGQFVRCRPLLTPTFGRVALRTYTRFVPIADIYHPFESLLAGKPYFGSGSSYTPTQVPFLNLSSLKNILLGYSSCSVYKVDGFNVIDNRTTWSNSTPEYVDYENVINEWAHNLQSSDGTDFTTYFSTQKSALKFNTVSNVLDHVSISGADFLEHVEYGSDDYILAFRLSRAGQNLRKILIGLGLQVSNASTEVSVVPLFAYYKCYFDQLMPQRDVTWKQTRAFRLMEFIEQNNKTFGWCFTNMMADVIEFFDSLCKCYYTQNPDFISAHITGTSLGNMVTDTSVSFIGSNGNSQSSSVFSTNMNYQVPVGSNAMISGVGGLDRVKINIVNVLSKIVNKKTAFGGRVDAYLRAILGSDYIDNHDSDFVGTSSLDVNISDVMSTAETAEGYLGEYAGKGIGAANGDQMSWNVKAPGYLISFAAIVPDSKYSQGLDMNLTHISKFDYYTPDLDAITLKPSPQAALFCCQDSRMNDNLSYTSGFGNIPNYSEYKIANNVLNGNVSLMSTRDSYLPYTLDKLLPYDYVEVDPSSGSGSIISVHPNTLVNGTIWRYIGLHPWIGNFNRIFTNSGYENNLWHGSVFDIFSDYKPIEDNFIIHNYVDLKVSSVMVPLSDSFDTDATDEKTMSVQKA